MIEGITVLNDEVVTKMPHWFTVTFIVCIVVMCAGGFICEQFDVDMISYAITISAVVLGASFIVALFNRVPTDKHEYQVLISDDASFNEVHEHYQIISSKGKIYTIRDKEGDTVAEENNEEISKE